MICPICNNKVEKFKSNSHIIPEWAYKPIYDSKGRSVLIDTRTDKVNLYQQHGVKGDFICENCEQETARLDSYGAKIFKPNNFSTKITEHFTDKNKTYFILKKEVLNFKMFQKFIYSIILRGYFYDITCTENHPHSSNKGLKRHVKNILEIYHSSDIDDESYPIWLRYIDFNTAPDLMKIIQDDAMNYCIMPPQPIRFFGHYFYVFIACGLSFNIKMSSHQLKERLQILEQVFAKNNTDILITQSSRAELISLLGAVNHKN